MKNADIRRLIDAHQIEWSTLARVAKIPFPDFVRLMNAKRLSPAVRRIVLAAIEKIAQRAENDN